MKLFPVMVGRFGREKAWLPWSVVEALEERAQTNHSQSLARLAERGGLAPGELADLLMDRKLTFDSGQSEKESWQEVWTAALSKLEVK